MKIINHLVGIVCLSFLPGMVLGQSAILEEYVQEALRQNLSVKTEKLRKSQQGLNVELARKNWMPSVDANASYLIAVGGRTISFPIGDLFNPVYGSLNEITQSDQFPTDLANQNIQLTPNNFLDLQLQITQPIINSSIKYNQLIQSELLKLNDIDIQLQEREVIFQTRNAYYNYLKTIEGFNILGTTETLLNDLLAINKKLVKYDKATGEIISDIEFQLAGLNSQRAQLVEQQAVAKAYFNLLLDRTLDTAIEIDEAILNDFTIQNTALDQLIIQAKSQRSEFKKIQIARQVNDLNKQRIDKEKLPTLGASAGLGLQTEAFDFDNGGPLYTLGLGMSVNLFDGGRRKKRIESIQVEQEMLAMNQAQLNRQIELETTNIFYALKSLESKLEADKAAARSARKSYDIIKSKYENDKAILLQVTDAQNKFITSELQQALTKYDYLIKLAELDKTIQ